MQALLILSVIDASTLHMNWLSLRNNQLKFQNFRRTTDHLKRIQRIFLKLIKKNRQMLTCNQFGLGNTRIWPIMPPKRSPRTLPLHGPPDSPPNFFEIMSKEVKSCSHEQCLRILCMRHVAVYVAPLPTRQGKGVRSPGHRRQVLRTELGDGLIRLLTPWD